MRSKCIAVAAAVLFLILAYASSAHAQAPNDPCSQVTAAQVSSALGETVGAAQKSNTVTCTWIADKPAHQIVTLMYSPPGDWTTRKTRQMPGVTKTSVNGVGDDAMAEAVGTFTTLYVKKGNTTFMVRAYGPPPDKQLTIETSIAQIVASKL
jgi:hypothetical protein